MAVNERRRSELFRALAATFGEEQAVTMFELLPPPDTELATRADTDRIEQRLDGVDQRFVSVDQRFDAVNERFDAVNERFDAVNQRITDLGHHMDERFEGQRREVDAKLDSVRDDLLAAFRGELVTAVTGQTRAVIVSITTAVFGLGGLAVALAQLL
jgi:hypothetical protein